MKKIIIKVPDTEEIYITNLDHIHDVMERIFESTDSDCVYVKYVDDDEKTVGETQ